MKLAVGSTNPAKVDAVARSLERYGPSVTPVAVDSGVDEQPRSIAATVEGAENRARRALETGRSAAASRNENGREAEFGVGLEGGVARLDGTPGRYLIMWAAATDGERIGRGAGPSIRLPDGVVTRVDAGEELGAVVADLADAEDVAEDEGAIGVLTGGLIDRTSALEGAVACAFGSFLTDHYG